MKRFLKIFLSCLVVLSSLALVQPAFALSPDPTYGTGGSSIIAFGGDTYGVQALAVQPDNKVVGVGFVSNNGNWDWTVVRYDTNGALDPGFGSGGRVTQDFGFTD